MTNAVPVNIRKDVIVRTGREQCGVKTIKKEKASLTMPTRAISDAITKYTRVFLSSILAESEGKSMLNMTIEQFEEKLNELIDLHKQMLEKQKDIRCKADGDNILAYDAETLLMFANKYKFPVSVERDDKIEEICRYRYEICYRDVELIGYSTERDYQLYKEGGMIS